jgi:bifunctional non-homologous end joining protein LigD
MQREEKRNVGLRKYHSKRDFSKTSEPRSGSSKSKDRQFVVQEHHARRLHWDFRLQFGGVLKSWAIPKGPSMDPNDKRLAVETEDHPIAYGKFEGEIPKGEYGAGQVTIWDSGTWDPPPNTRAALEKGHLDFVLHGKKLNGAFTLVRLKQREGEKNNWLLFKRRTEPNIVKQIIKSRRNLKNIPPPPTTIEPQLAQLVSRVPEGSEWLHEIKFDGYRTFCRLDRGKVTFLTRRGQDWSDRYASLIEPAKKINATNAIIDGEVVWIDDEGRSNFQKLQNAFSTNRFEHVVFYVFDLLFLNGKDLTSLPLEERKENLRRILTPLKNSKVIYSEHFKDRGHAMYLESCKLGLEGIVSKDANAPYLPGRSNVWQKIKCANQQEFVIGGYTVSDRDRPFGALLLGVYENEKLIYVGRVGTGFSDQTFKDLVPKLKSLETSETPFENPPRNRDTVWVKPKLVAEVTFRSWTDDRILRQASFQGLRQDKPSKEVHVESPARSSTKQNVVQNVKITHPDRIVYTKSKTTKIELVRYYEELGPLILPYIKDRPLAILRCQNDTRSGCYFQKHSEGRNLIGIVDKSVHYKDKWDTAISADSVTDIIELAQAGTVEMHVWNARFSNITNPDQIVLDLDPDSLDEWPSVVDTAHTIREMLESLNLKSFVKVTGGKGLHIQIPIYPKYDWDQVKNFSKSLMTVLEKQHRDRFVTNMSKKIRKGKIFLDYLRNGYGATAIVPYSLRARENPSVAFPISWKEVKPSLHPAQFQLKDVIRLVKRRVDPWKDYWSLSQRLEALDQLTTPLKKSA